MSHIGYEKWLHYIESELDEKVNEHYEKHLYDCDQCLALYLEAVEAIELKMPMMAEEAMFTDKVMEKIHQQKAVEKPLLVKQSNFYRKAIFHYIIAAAMTVLLMLSGVFSDLMNLVGDFEALNKNESSIVSGLMDKSISIIDKVTSESKEVK